MRKGICEIVPFEGSSKASHQMSLAKHHRLLKCGTHSQAFHTPPFPLKNEDGSNTLAYFQPSEPYFFFLKSRVESIFWLVFSSSSHKRTIKRSSLKELHPGLKTVTGQGARILPHKRGSCLSVLLDEQNEWDKWLVSLILHRGLSFCWLNNSPFCPFILAEGKENVREKGHIFMAQ